MRKVIFLILVVSAGLIKFGFTQDIKVKWYTIEEALELNKIHERKIFIDVYTDWCGWCKKMEATTFTHPAIAKILNEDYYAVRFDAETNDTIDFAGQKFINEGTRSRSPHQLAVALLQGKMSYPSIAYLNEKNQLLTAVPGYYTADRLEPLLKFFAEDAFKTISFQEYQKTFKSSIVTN
jgi:thioredoxin-related protein